MSVADFAVADNKSRRESTPGGVPRLACLWHFHTVVKPGTTAYEWNVVQELDNHSDTGDQCAGYKRAHKWGAGQTWVDVREAQDMHEGPGSENSGPLYVEEMDYMGARGRMTRGAASLCVVGRSSVSPFRDPADKGVAHLDTWFRLVPFFYDFGYVKLDHFIRSEMKCEKSFMSMQGGDCIQFSDDPAVPTLGFDVQTGWVGWWKTINGQRMLVWGFHALTGDTAKMLPLPG